MGNSLDSITSYTVGSYNPVANIHSWGKSSGIIDPIREIYRGAIHWFEKQLEDARENQNRLGALEASKHANQAITVSTKRYIELHVVSMNQQAEYLRRHFDETFNQPVKDLQSHLDESMAQQAMYIRSHLIG